MVWSRLSRYHPRIEIRMSIRSLFNGEYYIYLVIGRADYCIVHDTRNEFRYTTNINDQILHIRHLHLLCIQNLLSNFWDGQMGTTFEDCNSLSSNAIRRHHVNCQIQDYRNAELPRHPALQAGGTPTSA